jgi:hypothetical protein
MSEGGRNSEIIQEHRFAVVDHDGILEWNEVYLLCVDSCNGVCLGS